MKKWFKKEKAMQKISLNMFIAEKLEDININFDSILDVGTGDGEIAEYFKSKGKDVHCTTLCPETYNIPQTLNPKICDIEELVDVFGKEQFDAVWLWNVLEHVPNIKESLNNVRSVLKKDGYLIMSVPAFTNYVDGGHISDGWSIGHLMYTLLLNGFNIKDGKFLKSKKQIVAIVKRGNFPDVKIRYDHGDLNLLKDYFPIKIFDGFNGNLKNINWDLKFGNVFIMKLADFYTYIKRNYLKIW